MNRIDQLQTLWNENPTDAFLIYALALEFVKIKKNTEAKYYFEKLVTEHTTYLATYLQYGNLLAHEGNFEKAEVIYRMGMQIAASQKQTKTYNEIEQALFLMD